MIIYQLIEFYRFNKKAQDEVEQFAESILKRDTSSATGTGRLEVEANKFAAALLMPGEILNGFLREAPVDIEDETAIEQWAKEFMVSKAALQYRLRNL